jgi:hypothetical protein
LNQPDSRCFSNLHRSIAQIRAAPEDAATEVLVSATQDCTTCLAELREAMERRN